jgi:hypothetical protein
MLNICFAFGKLEFWCVPGKRLLHNKHPAKTLGTESPMKFTGWKHFTCAVLTHVNRVCPVTPLGEDPWKFVPGFLQTAPYTFSFG